MCIIQCVMVSNLEQINRSHLEIENILIFIERKRQICWQEDTVIMETRYEFADVAELVIG